MKFNFDLSYGEVCTIHDSLCMYLNDMEEQIKSYQGDIELLKESVAFKLYMEFRKVIEEVNNE